MSFQLLVATILTIRNPTLLLLLLLLIMVFHFIPISLLLSILFLIPLASCRRLLPLLCLLFSTFPMAYKPHIFLHSFFPSFWGRSPCPHNVHNSLVDLLLLLLCGKSLSYVVIVVHGITPSFHHLLSHLFCLLLITLVLPLSLSQWMAQSRCNL